jgi:His-Xaa-Ser system protein HxsD
MSVTIKAAKSIYSRDSLGIAAHIFAGRAEVYLGESGANWELTLKPKRAKTKDELAALGGEFMNELLNQEYRFLVSRFNSKIAGLVAAQALLSARGGETPRPAPAEEQDPRFKAEVERMLRDAAEEIKRTMPPRIAPQGTPLPPEETVA